MVNNGDGFHPWQIENEEPICLNAHIELLYLIKIHQC
jgi:hypothetical protein